MIRSLDINTARNCGFGATNPNVEQKPDHSLNRIRHDAEDTSTLTTSSNPAEFHGEPASDEEATSSSEDDGAWHDTLFPDEVGSNVYAKSEIHDIDLFV